MFEIASYEEVKDLPNHPEKILIDVRETVQVQKMGNIPTSINIPIGELEEALKLSSTEFETKYLKKFNGKDQELIFHCRKGGRAGKAADLAKSLGFDNVKNYKGSWSDWAQREGLPYESVNQ